MALLKIIGFLLIIAYIDYEHLKDNDYIEDHKSRVALRLWFCIFASNSLIEFTGMAIFIMATFDNTLNLMRFGKKGLWRLGKTATWDKFWRSIPEIYKLFTIICLVVSVLLLLKS